MTLGIIRDSRFLEHETRPHPERPERLEKIYERLSKASFSSELIEIEYRPADRAFLRRLHSDEMIDRAFDLSALGGGHLDMDTVVSSKSAEVALLAVGAAQAAVMGIGEQGIKRAMVLSRPPGHHATPSRSMGFCLFNNVALAAEAALGLEGVQKVAIIDFDVHHGNGTQDCFYDRPDVFFLSLHQWPHYPGTGLATHQGTREGRGTTLNFPLGAGVTHEEWMGAFQLGLEAVSKYDPDFFLISAGFDSHKEDPLGDFPLTDQSFGRIGELLGDLAGEKGVVALLEGGYHLEALSKSVVTFLDGLR